MLYLSEIKDELLKLLSFNRTSFLSEAGASYPISLREAEAL